MAQPRVFVSYSHRDSSVLESLLPFLTTLESDRLADIWSDERLRAGDQWRQELDAALDAATIAILLISQQFLASEFVREHELPRILSRQEERKLTVLPVFVSPSTASSSSITFRTADGTERQIVLSDFQGFGTPQRTLREMPRTKQERCFVALSERIRELSHASVPVTEAASTARTQERAQPEAQLAEPERVVGEAPDRPERFHGRTPHVKEVGEYLASTSVRLVSLIGPSGIGKTALAAQLLSEIEANRWPADLAVARVDGIAYLSTRR